MQGAPAITSTVLGAEGLTAMTNVPVISLRMCEVSGRAVLKHTGLTVKRKEPEGEAGGFVHP